MTTKLFCCAFLWVLPFWQMCEPVWADNAVILGTYPLCPASTYYWYGEDRCMPTPSEKRIGAVLVGQSGKWTRCVNGTCASNDTVWPGELIREAVKSVPVSASVSPVLQCWDEVEKTWAPCAGRDLTAIPIAMPSELCAYDGKLPVTPALDNQLGEYRTFEPCKLPYAYVFNEDTQLWHRASDPKCLATMAAAMREMDWLLYGEFDKVLDDTPRQYRVKALWDAAKACWGKP